MHEKKKISDMIYDKGRQEGNYCKRMGHKDVLYLAEEYTKQNQDKIQGCRSVLERQKVHFLKIPSQYQDRILFYNKNLMLLLEHSILITSSEYQTRELVIYLQGKGFRIPKDISIVGVDDIM